MDDAIRVAVIDDHPLLREGIVRTLEAEADFTVVGEGGSADEAVEIAQEHLPDILMLDVSMPGGGIEAARRVADSCPVVRIVMLTVSEDEKVVSAALQAGVRGYILKGVSGRELTALLRGIHNGETYVTPALAGRILADIGGSQDREEGAALTTLTSREEQILRLVSGGLSNKEIARQLDLSDKTVKHYMTNIFQKLHVRNRVEAALLASRQKPK